MAGGIKSRALHACLMGVPFTCPVEQTDRITHEILKTYRECTRVGLSCQEDCAQILPLYINKDKI
jgi:hypothetical protein